MTKSNKREEAANASIAMLNAGLFRALGEPVRIEIFRQLILKGRSDVNTIAETMPQDRSVIARHLQLMARAGVLHSQSVGRHVFYEIDGPALVQRMTSLTRALESIVPMCCPRSEE